MALVLEALRVRQDPRHHATHRVGHRHSGNLPAGEDEVSQGQLFIHTFVNESLVNALVMAANQDQTLHLAEANGVGLAKGVAAGG